MDKKFEEIIKNVISQRTSEIENNIIDNEYKKAEKKAIELYNKIRDALPCDYRELFYEYEDILNYISITAEKLQYKQGLKDGIGLANILEKL